MAGLNILFLLIIGLSASLNAGTVERIYIRDNKQALKGSDIELVCKIAQFSSSDTFYVFKSESRLPSSLAGVTSLTQCIPSQCLTTSLGRYRFSADNNHVFINITEVNRSEDQKWWTCAIFNQRKDLQLNVLIKVSSATLKDGTHTVSVELQVVSGLNKTLTCDTSVSRPTATIVWYIGVEDKQRSTSNTFTFKPDSSYHNKEIYCKAFNIQPESQAVTSYKSTLQVQVQVSSVTLKDGSSAVSGQMQVVSGVGKTLTCDTDVSRSAATTIWYIGLEEKQRSTSKTFTFIPDNSDHDRKVYCKAFNTQPESQAVISIQSTLYVKVYVTTPTLSNKTVGSLILLENDSITLECVTSATRPAATVRWMKGSSNLTNIKNTYFTRGNLVSVKSVVTFTPEKTDDRKVISCQTFVPEQVNKPSSQQTVSVYWPPSTPIIPVTQFPFLEGQTGKSIYCSSKDYGNPSSTATWTKQYGTPDRGDSRRLNLPTLTSQINGSPLSCQLNNYFTQVKGLTKMSSTERLNVEYKPVVQIMISGIITNSVTINEGQPLSALCSATGNPTPTVKWRDQSSSSFKLIFDDIDRSNHGNYTCRAEATSTKYLNFDFVSEENLDITVNYAPEVTVVVSEADPIENSSLQISCNATGRPNKFMFTSMLQIWKGITILNSHLPINGPFDGMIKIQKLQLEDTGTYTCHVNNGIPDRKQKLDQIGKADISVKVSPKVLLEDNYIFARAPGKSANVSIPFYSYPDIRSVTFQFKNGTQIHDSNKYTTSYSRQNVTAQFYGKPIELEGYVAVLNINKEEENDVDNYTLVLENGIPLNPILLYYIGNIDGLESFIFVSGLNGGRPQTFVIETVAYGTNNWIERLRFNESDETYFQNDQRLYRFDIKVLIPGIYSLRVLAGNDLGWIAADLAPKINFTVYRNEKQCQSAQQKSDDTAAIVGGSLSIVIVGIILASVFINRRVASKQSDSNSSDNAERLAPSSYYDSLQTQNDANSTYSTLTGPQHDFKDNTYENMKTHGRHVTSDDL